MAQPDTGALQLRELDHQAGYLSSQGTVILQWRAPCEGPPDAPPTRVKLAYRISHVPGWDHAGGVSWSATPEGEAGAALREIMAGSAQLQGQGTLGYDGLLQTRMQLPALRLDSGDTVLQVAPSQGRLALGRNALQLDWSLDRLERQGGGAALGVQQLALALRLDDRARGSGSLTLDAERIDSGALALQGVRLRTETRASGERLQATLSQSAQSLRLFGQTLNDLQLELTAADLHGPSLQRLGALYAQSCGLRALSAPVAQQWRTALGDLLAAGFSLGVSRLQGRSKGGSLEGSLRLQLLPAPEGRVALAAQLQSSGQLRISGELLAPEQRQAALESGWLQEEPGGLRGRLDYRAGALQLGTGARDSALVDAALARLDGALQGFLQAQGSWSPQAAASDAGFDGPNAPATLPEPAAALPAH